MPERFAVERKGSLGIWSAKTCDVFKDGSIILYEAGVEKGTLKRIAIVSVAPPDDQQPTVITLIARGDEFTLRVVPHSPQQLAHLSQVIEKGVATRAKLLALPSVDPRNGLAFIDVPANLVSKFGDLERAVLYWLAPITKYGAPSTFSKSFSTEDRVAFCSDTALYITKPNSEVTRCLRISNIAELITNENSPTSGSSSGAEDEFVGVRMQRPDYDVLLSGPGVAALVVCIVRLYETTQMGKALDVSHAKSVADISLDRLTLKRPSGYSMKMIVPTQRDKLRKALEEFGKKNNLRFTEGGVVVSPTAPPSDAPKTATPNGGPAARSPNAKPVTPLQQSVQPPTQKDNSVCEEVRQNPLYALLDAAGCASQYYYKLSTQNVDIDIVECMDETDLRTYGITDTQHIARILEAIEQRRNRTSTSLSRTSSSPVANKPPVLQTTSAVKSSPSQPLPPSAKPLSNSVPITLSDSDLDDEDDDLDISVGSAKPRMQIVLSSDDEDDMPPPRSAPTSASPQRTAVILDDDDI